MDWQHWFEVILTALAGIVVYIFKQFKDDAKEFKDDAKETQKSFVAQMTKMQEDFSKIKDHLGDVKGDLRAMVEISKAHEKRIELVEKQKLGGSLGNP